MERQLEKGDAAEQRSEARWPRIALGVLVVALVAMPLMTVVYEMPGSLQGLVHSEGYLAAMVLLLYGLAALWSRRRFLGDAVLERALARVRQLRARLGQVELPMQQRRSVEGLLEHAETRLLGQTPRDRWICSLAPEVAGQAILDEAELAIERREPVEVRRARLAELAVRLERSKEQAQEEQLLQRLRDTTQAGEDPLAMLGDVYRVVLSKEYELAEKVAGQHRKNVWHLAAGTIVLIVAASLLGNAALMLAGALGATVNRLFALLRSERLTSDFRLTWTSFLVGPIYGALAAYGAILGVIALRQLGVLGDAFTALDWGEPLAPVMLGLAFLLGFSDHLIDRLADQSRGLLPAKERAATRSDADHRHETEDQPRE